MSIAESLRKAGYLQPVSDAFNKLMAKRDYDEKMASYFKSIDEAKQNVNNSLTPKVEASMGIQSLMPKNVRTPSNQNDIPAMRMIEQKPKMQMNVQEPNISDVRHQFENSIYDLAMNAAKNNIPNDVSQLGLKALAGYGEGVLPKPIQYENYDPKKGEIMYNPNTGERKITRDPQTERRTKTINFDNKIFEYNEETGELRPLVEGSFKGDGTITEGGIQYAYKIGNDGKPIKVAIGRPDKATVHHTGNYGGKGGSNNDNKTFSVSQFFRDLLYDSDSTKNYHLVEALDYLSPDARAAHAAMFKGRPNIDISTEEFRGEVNDPGNGFPDNVKEELLEFSYYRPRLTGGKIQ